MTGGRLHKIGVGTFYGSYLPKINYKYRGGIGGICHPARAIGLVDGELRGGYQPWHVDWIYMDEIARGGMMAPVRLPGSGGDTGFIDQIEAYARLPDRLKAKAETLKHREFQFWAEQTVSL